MLDDDVELEEAMAALPLEQIISDFARQQRTAPQPFAAAAATHNVLLRCPHASTKSSACASPYVGYSVPLPPPIPPLSSRTSLFPPPPPPPPPPSAHPAPSPAVHVVPTFPTFELPPSTAVPPLSQLLSEWRYLRADWRCGTPSLLNDPYEVCHAIVKRLRDDIDEAQMAAATTHTTNSSSNSTRAPTESQKQLCGVYCELMALLDLPCSPFAPSSLSSLRSPPSYEPALLHHLACIAYNTALSTADWSMASYFCHFALQLLSLPDVPLPADTPNCLSSMSLYLVAVLDELAARETASVHAVYGEAMLRVLEEKRRREREGDSSGIDGGLADMLDVQARMYVASGRRQWAEEERQKQKEQQKDKKKRKRNTQRTLAQSQQWQQASQCELDDVRQRLLSLLTQRTIKVNKCEQLLAVAFRLQLSELQRPLVDHIVHYGSTTASVDWQLHYLELLCMLSSDEQLFVFASSTQSSSVFSSLHFPCWQYLCERCWTAGTVLVRGGTSELGERLLAVAIRLLERACLCDANERVCSTMDEVQVLSQLNSVLTYVRERDAKQQLEAAETGIV